MFFFFIGANIHCSSSLNDDIEVFYVVGFVFLLDAYNGILITGMESCYVFVASNALLVKGMGNRSFCRMFETSDTTRITER